jgi:PAS domain-containing protein
MTTKTENAEFGVFLMAQSPNPNLVCRADTAIAYVNPAFEKLTGFRVTQRQRGARVDPRGICPR